MKKLLIYLAGLVSGIVLTLLVSMFMVANTTIDDITLFEHEGECISENSFKIFQVVDNGNALASEIDEEFEFPTNLVVLLLAEKGKAYYDNQIIRIPPGKCAKQIGTYRYFTRDEMEKTVPIVAIRDK